MRSREADHAGRFAGYPPRQQETTGAGGSAPSSPRRPRPQLRRPRQEGSSILATSFPRRREPRPRPRQPRPAATPAAPAHADGQRPHSTASPGGQRQRRLGSRSRRRHAEESWSDLVPGKTKYKGTSRPSPGRNLGFDWFSKPLQASAEDVKGDAVRQCLPPTAPRPVSATGEVRKARPRPAMIRCLPGLEPDAMQQRIQRRASFGAEQTVHHRSGHGGEPTHLRRGRDARDGQARLERGGKAPLPDAPPQRRNIWPESAAKWVPRKPGFRRWVQPRNAKAAIAPPTPRARVVVEATSPRASGTGALYGSRGTAGAPSNCPGDRVTAGDIADRTTQAAQAAEAKGRHPNSAKDLGFTVSAGPGKWDADPTRSQVDRSKTS